MTPPDDADEYVRAIEEEFVRRRGAALLLSPKDWALITEWREAGVPLRLVLQALANVFDSFALRAPGGRRINSLSYCRQEVLALHELHNSLRGVEAGRPAAEPTAAGAGRLLVRHLGRLHRRLRLAMTRASNEGRDVLVGAIALCGSELTRLRAEARTGSVDPLRLDAELRALDAGLLEAGRAALSAEAIARIDGEADRALASDRPRMTPAAYHATRAAFLSRALRESLSLPRLTLFD
ncbi:MAG TPA: hypothetical protein VGA64_12295 [Candidatus Polarisedimenticolia bacterium]